MTPQDSHGLENYICLTKEECLFQDLTFLELQGLTYTFTLREIDNTDINLLDRIAAAFGDMLANSPFTFPGYNSTFTLPHT